MRKALASGLMALTLIGASVSGAGPAAADPARGGRASSFGATATLAGSDVVPPTPEANLTAPPFGDDLDQELVDLSVLDPLTGGGAAVAEARVHVASDITSVLETETQPVAGPYNAQAVGGLDDAEVLIDVVGVGIPLVEADLIRAEAVAKCVGSTVTYSGISETQNLRIADVADLGNAIDDLLGVLLPGLDPLDPVLNVEENVITQSADGISVDALVVTLLDAAAPGAGVVQVRVGHAEVSGVTCGAAAAVPECSDDADNDADGVIDEADPGCHTDGDPANPDSFDPNDDDEGDDGGPACADGVDNDADGVIDAADPGCHTDGNPDNPDSFDPTDDDESDGGCADRVDNDSDGRTDIVDPDCHTDGNAGNPDSFDPNRNETSGAAAPVAIGLPRTGTSVPTAAAAGLGLAALAMLALRRRTTV